MRNLINFLIKNSSWFVFIFLEIICFYFIFTNNPYQNSVFFNSFNEITGKVYSISGTVTSYFGLKGENEELLQKNAELQEYISTLQNYVYSLDNDTSKMHAFLNDSTHQKANLKLVIARVERNSVSLIENYIIANKGKNQGIKEDMGVISQQGIVGVVRSTSPNYAIIQPVLNPHSRFSCKVLNSNTAGTLIWEGNDPRYANLTEYPKYERVEKGDTIVTSGFSDIFPEGIFVGVVEDFKSETNDNFYSLKIKLSTDFGSLKNVFIINKDNEEIKELENKILDNAQK